MQQLGDFKLLPLFAAVLLPVLIVRGIYVPIAPDAAGLWPTASVGDTRSWWKALFTVGIGLWLVLALVPLLASGWRPRRRLFAGLLAAAAVATLVSTLLSPFPYTAWLGYPTLYEGAPVLLAYLAIAWYAAEVPRREAEQRRLLRLMGGVCLLEAALGIGEGFGWQLWRTGFGHWLMGAGDANVLYRFADNRMAYGTVFQPNHYGMLMAMLGALSLGMAFREDSRFWRIFWGMSFLLAVAAVFASNSRAAISVLVGVAAAYAAYAAYAALRRGGGWSWAGLTRAVVLASAAAGILLLLLPKELALRFVERLVKAESAAGSRPQVEAVGLANNRIQVRLGGGEILTLEKSTAPSWRIESAGTSRLVDGVPDATGWLTLRVREDPDIGVKFRPAGPARLLLPDLSVEFHSVGDKLFWVDKAGGRLRTAVAAGRYIPSGGEGFLNGRGYIWRRALEVWREQPIFGTGPGTFAQAFPNGELLNRQRFSHDLNEDKGHGIWATFLVQVGLAGLLLFSLPVLYTVLRLIKTRSAFAEPLFLALAAYGVCSLANDSSVGVTPLFCVLVGLAVAADSSALP